HGRGSQAYDGDDAHWSAPAEKPYLDRKVSEPGLAISPTNWVNAPSSMTSRAARQSGRQAPSSAPCDGGADGQDGEREDDGSGRAGDLARGGSADPVRAGRRGAGDKGRAAALRAG